MDQKNNNGFTIMEIMVSLALLVIIILMTATFFSMAQKSYSTGTSEGELTQNARVSLDRVSRELRQSGNLVTSLPTTDTDPGNPPAQEIFFQDGHDPSQITYTRYYLSGNNLMRAREAYYFPADPSTYVIWNSLDQFGGSPTKLTLEDRVVGEYFKSLQFWGDQGLIHIKITLEKNQKDLQINTSVFSRN